MERAGLPTALVTAMTELAERVGAPRIVQGRAIGHPFGDPSLPGDEEAAYRRRLVERAVESLERPVSGPTIFRSPE
jgi:betaine reductase